MITTRSISKGVKASSACARPSPSPPPLTRSIRKVKPAVGKNKPGRPVTKGGIGVRGAEIKRYFKKRIGRMMTIAMVEECYNLLPDKPVDWVESTFRKRVIKETGVKNFTEVATDEDPNWETLPVRENTKLAVEQYIHTLKLPTTPAPEINKVEDNPSTSSDRFKVRLNVSSYLTTPKVKEEPVHRDVKMEEPQAAPPKRSMMTVPTSKCPAFGLDNDEDALIETNSFSAFTQV